VILVEVVVLKDGVDDSFEVEIYAQGTRGLDEEE
jgi:hypothetical protein